MFNDWLLKQLQEKDWTQADLSRASGLTTAAISKYVNGRIPDKGALKKISKAFDLPPEIVYRAAGEFQKKDAKTELIEQIEHLTSDLPEQEQRDILEFIKLRHRISEQRGKNETKRTANRTATPK